MSDNNMPGRVARLEADMRSLKSYCKEFERQVEQMKRNNCDWAMLMSAMRDGEGKPDGETIPETYSSDQDDESVSQATTADESIYWQQVEVELERTVKEQRRTIEGLDDVVKSHIQIIYWQETYISKCEEGMRRLGVRNRNLVEELATAKGNIRVMCRVRPVNDVPGEDLIRFTNPDNPDNGNSVAPWTILRATYMNESKKRVHRDFEFQRAFGGNEANATIFNEVKDFAQSAALGNSCTIMAYGATGTGKSYTFLSDDGLVNSFIDLLFRLAEEDTGQFQYEIYLSAVEIYLNDIFDLLQVSDDQKVKVHLGKESSVELRSQEEAFGTIQQAINRREASSTRQNATSSRSHFFISVRIVRRSVADGKETTGIASFVDLAGSEAVGKTLLSEPASKQQALQSQQGTDINKSLLDLGNNIRSLAKGSKFVPNHNLTRCLRQSLIQGSRLLIITTVSPLVTNQSNTLATLNWAAGFAGSTDGSVTKLTSEKSPPRPAAIGSGTKESPDSKRSSSRTPVTPPKPSSTYKPKTSNPSPAATKSGTKGSPDSKRGSSTTSATPPRTSTYKPRASNASPAPTGSGTRGSVVPNRKPPTSTASPPRISSHKPLSSRPEKAKPWV
ncbi:P-loop containing nucleoside triphosphate hydrolase protein [Xylaria sp. FL1042]|nr:P-loop containing nucleoside triphosphate hydrolase protein [Xylaria sp. FL1042]